MVIRYVYFSYSADCSKARVDLSALSGNASFVFDGERGGWASDKEEYNTRAVDVQEYAGGASVVELEM